jgi:hypothetical protein
MNKVQLREMIKEMLGEENGEEERTPRDPEPTPEELKKMRAYVDMLGAEQAEKEADEAAWFSDDWKLEETQWGGFTGGAAPLDEPALDSGPMSPEQQQKVFDILVDTGSDPEELKASGDFPDVIGENIMNIKKIIKEETRKYLTQEGKVADAFTHAAATDQPLTKWVPLLKKIAAHPEFQAIAAAGKTDAAGPKDEAFVVKPETATASKLQAMQKEIGFNKSLKDQVTNPKWKPVDAALGLKGTPIEMPCQDTRCAILTFAGKYILDGHHRWSQIMMMNPDAQVAIDDLQPTGVLKNPEDALKVMQLAIALKADKVVTEPFDGADLMASTPEEVAQFVKKNIKDEVLQLMVQAEKIPKPDKELAAKYIAANLPAIQKLKGKFVRGEVMPQAGKSGTSQDAVNQALATGAVNFIKPRPEDVKKKLGEAKKQLRKIIREELRAVVS